MQEVSLDGPGPTTAERLVTRLGPLTLRNPVLPASGCFGPELASVMPVDRLGAAVTKTVFSDVRSGNPAHRITETRNGMLNSVGIPSIGATRWRAETLPALLDCGVPLVISLGGLAEADYRRVAEDLAGVPAAAFELNVSCPNLEAGGVELGADPAAVTRTVAGVREVTDLPLLVKLTPNVASVVELAQAAVRGGADAVVVANTFVGMAIDLHRRRPVIGNGVGGWSGPAAKPLILRMVWQVAEAVDVPIVGCGGITSAHDVAEYLVAGASAVQVGTATFTRPQIMTEIIADLPRVLDELGVSRVTELIGTLQSDARPSPERTTP
ncbi:dihydroorotate dehydrogenase [Actinoallomurus sp. NBC_01490]|uniref:dihydroorotate dehydrogenase n=1 Tax=Actinoallomurus sp. NBC_01490 TaxID=2903557 RepID=UPI002E345FCB|nr:dihydroorotate dehydrogenase [Actinoallomurus sp. NBC_01490]